MVAAQAQLTAMLGPDTKTLGVLSESPWVCGFHSRGKTVLIVWDDRDAGRTCRPTRGKLLDICGNEVGASVQLGETPVYVVTDGALTADEAAGVVTG